MADNDRIFEERRETWDSFVRFATWGTVGVAGVLILMAIFLL